MSRETENQTIKERFAWMPAYITAVFTTGYLFYVLAPVISIMFLDDKSIGAMLTGLQEPQTFAYLVISCFSFWMGQRVGQAESAKKL